MNIARLAIKRPVFITCIVAVILIIGGIAYQNIGLELMPDTSFPMVAVTTTYPGASPEEIEQLISKPLEDKLGSSSGLKHISSTNQDGISMVMMEFEQETDIDKVAEDIRDKIAQVEGDLPDDLPANPVVHKFDPDSMAVVRLALLSDLPAKDMYDLAKERLKPQIEKIKDVGTVDIIGGTRREIQIEIDRNKLNEYRIPMTTVVNKIKSSGTNVPIGSKEGGSTEVSFRAIGEFTDLDKIRDTPISFSGDVGKSVSLIDMGTVSDGTEDAESIGYMYYPINGNKQTAVQSCVYLDVIKQSGKNTVEVTDGVKAQLDSLNKYLEKQKGKSRLVAINDQSKWIRTNVDETVTTIIIGIFLAVFVVFLFLGNVRSTIITAIAIPNSLLGAVILMYLMNYTFNILTLMALSLVVGLLVDDAIVVRENIFRKLEKGEKPKKAAETGTTEVMLAVIATTMAILSVFFPIGMISGMMGKMFKQFGFTIIFAMLVSLFDALTVAPFLSAYFAKDGTKSNMRLITYFEKFQVRLEQIYGKIMKYCLSHPLVIIGCTLAIFLSAVLLYGLVKATYMPSGDRGEFAVNIEMPPGTSLTGTGNVLKQIEERLKKEKDIEFYCVTVGNANGDAAAGSISCTLRSDRAKSSDQIMGEMRGYLKKNFPSANPSVDVGFRRDAPFVLVVSGNTLASVEKASDQIMEKVKKVRDLMDVQSSLKKGKPEFRVNFDKKKMQSLGVSDSIVGNELRYDVTGAVVGSFRENGISYDIRARLKPEQRDIRATYDSIKVPNSNNVMVPLNMVSTGESTTGFAKITRKDKAYIVELSANLGPDAAIGNIISEIDSMIARDVKLPEGVSYSYSGEAQRFGETLSSVVTAMILAIVFLFLVLASLYESFITPFTILLAIPPALTGALLALVLTGHSLDMFSMIGMVMLLGIVTKNSILLVDNAVKGVQSGLDKKDAILQAGLRRLRPILMTTFAMIAGTLPLAMGIGEAAKMRQSMGIAIIGGLIISTFVTLIVVPAVFEYIDKFRAATEAKILVREKDEDEDEIIETSALKKKLRTKKKEEYLITEK